MKTVFERITIIGLGLIGSSIARAVRKYGVADIIVGYDLSEIALTYARSEEFIDVPAGNPRQAVKNSQLIILATPPANFETLTHAIAPSLEKNALVMDTASVKRMTMRAIGAHLPQHAHFVPAHPITGSQYSGVSAGNADLFKKCRVIVTPENPVTTQSLRLATRFWQGLGARVEAMPPEMHDMIYAYVSHLPHLLSFASRHIVDSEAADYEQLRHTFLRIGYSDPKLWIELFYMNQDNILVALDRYLDAIVHIRKELSEAPHDAEQEPNGSQARNVLFPRIAAACLVTTVMESERRTSIPFARFAGRGFADFTSPASENPDGDIGAIAKNYEQVEKTLAQYQRLLKRFHTMLANQQYKELFAAITQ